MQCLRCQTEMKHYDFNQDFHIYGAWHQSDSFSAECQKPHNPQSIYVCDNCGYMELSTKPCEESDI